MWYLFDEGQSIGQQGMEGGIILLDEEHSGGARITLEEGGFRPFSITCGIYGWMVHTCFFSSHEMARQQYELMKVDLANLLDLIPNHDEDNFEDKNRPILQGIRQFIEGKYP